MANETKKLSMPIGRDVIDAGIGTIGYTTQNLQLKLIMEELEKCILKHGPTAALSLLQDFND